MFKSEQAIIKGLLGIYEQARLCNANNTMKDIEDTLTRYNKKFECPPTREYEENDK